MSSKWYTQIDDWTVEFDRMRPKKSALVGHCHRIHPDKVRNWHISSKSSPEKNPGMSSKGCSEAWTKLAEQVTRCVSRQLRRSLVPSLSGVPVARRLIYQQGLKRAQPSLTKHGKPCQETIDVNGQRDDVWDLANAKLPSKHVQFQFYDMNGDATSPQIQATRLVRWTVVWGFGICITLVHWSP